MHLPSQTCLVQFKAGSFHIAFDKGALDALMGEDTDAASTAGGKLLSEVQKVLDPAEGQYLCVTLGQPHVLGDTLSMLHLSIFYVMAVRSCMYLATILSMCIDRYPCLPTDMQ